MDVFIVETLEFAGNIREIGIEDRIAFCFPPEPVLHDCVERNVLFAIAMCDCQELLLAKHSGPSTERIRTPIREASGVCPVRFRYSWMIWSISGP